MGFRMEDIKYLVHSHAHADHVAGDALIQEAVPGIELWVMEGEALLLPGLDCNRERLSIKAA